MIPIRPSEILDPYPDRSTSTSGVRQHIPPAASPNRKVTTESSAVGPLPFVAGVTPTQSGHVRGCRFPLASTGLYVLGQVALAVTIAFGAIGPLLGIAVCVIWMLCGLTLIGAEVLCNATGPFDDGGGVG